MTTTADALEITLRVNAHSIAVTVGAGDSLLDVLRRDLGLTGSRETCGIGLCGACAVVLDDRAVNACITPAFPLDGSTVTTVEGLATGRRLSALQQAFVDRQAMQCAFCTSGFLMSAAAALDSDAPAFDVNSVFEGHLCRCASYTQIQEALRDVAEPNKSRSSDRTGEDHDGSRIL